MINFLRERQLKSEKLNFEITNSHINLGDEEECLRLARRLKWNPADREWVNLDLGELEFVYLSQYLLCKRLIKTRSIINVENVVLGIFHINPHIRLTTFRILIKLQEVRGTVCPQRFIQDYAKRNPSQDLCANGFQTQFVNNTLLEEKHYKYVALMNNMHHVEDVDQLYDLVDLYSDEDDKLLNILALFAKNDARPFVYFLDSIVFDCNVVKDMIDVNLPAFCALLERLCSQDLVSTLYDYSSSEIRRNYENSDYYCSFKLLISQLLNLCYENTAVTELLYKINSILG